MIWYHHDAGGWGWIAVTVGMILFWALVIALGLLLYRAVARPGRSGERADARPPAAAAEQLLAERFARGEMDEDEYRRRLAVLRETTGGDSRPGQR